MTSLIHYLRGRRPQAPAYDVITYKMGSGNGKVPKEVIILYLFLQHVFILQHKSYKKDKWKLLKIFASDLNNIQYTFDLSMHMF